MLSILTIHTEQYAATRHSRPLVSAARMLMPRMLNSLSIKQADVLLDHKTRCQLFRLDLKITQLYYGFESNPHTGWRSGG